MIYIYLGLVFGYFIIPPSIMSGILGLIWFSIIEMFDPLMTSDLRSGLDALKGNLINFVFAALILGTATTLLYFYLDLYVMRMII